MRAFVIKGGIPTFISKREEEFIESMNDLTYKSDLNEQQRELAKVLTSRGVLERFMDVDKGIYYTPNCNKGI